ncbi:protein cramped-like [Argiope bruennichi]|uniref:Protein cramped-like like protein n=1 Tax=Argiope bruennichi TaxID=94029 RepID=A0A8T0FI12_ARGBR|nr:protein cramped-like [Argiope bruennichi]XP_055929294.1 protein cramped-like [Argiope bruennichi]KAF8790641.1 Protein cramped-like like protein [Argiope bruennichi]
MPGEGEEAVDNDIDPDTQQTTLSKTRSHLPRAASSKETTEVTENDVATSATTEKKLNNNQRCSNRLTKRLKRDSSPVDTVTKKSVSVKQPEPSVESKTRRPWELWSVEDKNAFFEALCEYGKDFESIQTYIAQRGKKKGVATNMIKNKNQVRHFYYRTWHKISKYLDINECVKKQTQELYGLINYAELRKKIGGCLNEKNRQKLNELVFSGVTTVKHKGKKLRIKTPVCRALKKLNNVADTKEPEAEKLPKEIVVEFRPHTNNAWLHVQNLAQNPRVRTKVCLQKRLRSVIEYLQQRWKPYRLKRKEQILSSLPTSFSEELPCDIPPILRVKPAKNAKIYPLTLSVMDVASSSDVCLENYMKLFHNTLCKENTKTKKPLCLNQKIQNDKLNEGSEIVSEKNVPNADTLPDHTDLCNNSDLQELCFRTVNKTLDDPTYINVLTPPKSVPEECPEPSVSEAQRPRSFSPKLDVTSKRNASSSSDDAIEKVDGVPELNFRTFESKYGKTLEDPNKCKLLAPEPEIMQDNDSDSTMTLGEFISLKTQNDRFSPLPVQEKEKSSSENSLEVTKDGCSSNESDSIYYRTVRNGWTVEESGFLTFGELYLLFGKPATLVLEYEFEPSDCEDLFGISQSTSSKTNALNKVLEVALNYFMDTKNKQLLAKQKGSSKSTKVKTCSATEKSTKDALPFLDSSSDANHSTKGTVVPKDIISTKTPINISDSTVSSVDKHVFAMPVGTAPRNVKPADQTSLKEEIGKLLPGTRRGCRVRRKPLVVQRPLLPREGMPRPMTVVHFVPSISSLTTVIPTNCAQPENKINIPPPKKVVQILQPGAPIDMHPIQVPIVKQVHTDSGQNLVFQQSPIQASRVIVNSTVGNSIQIISDSKISLGTVSTPNVTSSSIQPIKENQPSIENNSLISEIELPSPPSLDALNLGILNESQNSTITPDDTFVTMQQMAMLDTSNSTLSNITPTVGSSFLEEFGISNKSKLYDPSPNPTNFGEDQLSTLKRNTPPGSPNHQPFRVNSPEIQWFNGESTELSLNTFLNSVESPTKLTCASTSNVSTENSNFDPIARLAPVVDSQVRCLLDECSIDFITKFEDLADVINNSSSNDSKPT